MHMLPIVCSHARFERDLHAPPNGSGSLFKVEIKQRSHAVTRHASYTPKKGAELSFRPGLPLALAYGAAIKRVYLWMNVPVYVPRSGPVGPGSVPLLNICVAKPTTGRPV
jgi:hypothetical protein